MVSDIKHVTFKNSDMYWEIAADIYLPPNFDESKQYPAIVVAHPIGSCKEQTSGEIYSAQLADEGSAEAVIAKLEEIGAQRTAEARGADWQIDGGLPGSVEQAKEMGITDVDILGATEYYKTDRGAKPNGVNKTLRSHMAAAYGWDAFHLAEELLTQPLLVIVGDIPGAFGAYRDGYEIVRRARSQKKELAVIEGWSHYDLYDQDQPVAKAMAKLTPFFTENL